MRGDLFIGIKFATESQNAQSLFELFQAIKNLFRQNALGKASLITASGSTAPSASNPLWTLKPASTKNTHVSCIHYPSTKSRQGHPLAVSGGHEGDNLIAFA
jgi:hypothetical protein